MTFRVLAVSSARAESALAALSRAAAAAIPAFDVSPPPHPAAATTNTAKPYPHDVPHARSFVSV